MSVVDEVGIDVRGVTDEEVGHFREKGWVMLRGLISEEVAAELLARAKARMGETGEQEFADEKTLGRTTQHFRTYYKIDEEDTLFRALRTHRQMGHNAARLFGRDMRIRSNTTLVAPKLPSSLAGKISGTGKTDWHQDYNVPGICNSIGVWLALAEATAEMGTMRFHEGSHRLGWLAPPASEWPAVRALPLSEPLDYRPGDATVHHQHIVHGAPENASDQVRWAYIFSYFPGDAPYLGTPNPHTDGLGLEIGKPFDHPNFPLVYTPGLS
jgi:ectoine hydroxylase-related dioxygenase (phytanoyl-CoA dioxygenase family)